MGRQDLFEIFQQRALKEPNKGASAGRVRRGVPCRQCLQPNQQCICRLLDAWPHGRHTVPLQGRRPQLCGMPDRPLLVMHVALHWWPAELLVHLQAAACQRAHGSKTAACLPLHLFFHSRLQCMPPVQG